MLIRGQSVAQLVRVTRVFGIGKSKSPEGFGLPGFGYVSLRWMLFRTSTRGPKAGKPYELHTAATITRAGHPREHSLSYNVQAAVKSSRAGTWIGPFARPRGSPL